MKFFYQFLAVLLGSYVLVFCYLYLPNIDLYKSLSLSIVYSIGLGGVLSCNLEKFSFTRLNSKNIYFLVTFTGLSLLEYFTLDKKSMIFAMLSVFLFTTISYLIIDKFVFILNLKLSKV